MPYTKIASLFADAQALDGQTVTVGGWASEMLEKVPEVNDSFKLYSSANPRNDLFNLQVVFNYGTFSDPDLSRAVQYLDYQGTETQSFEEFALALQKIGAKISVFSNEEEGIW